MAPDWNACLEYEFQLQEASSSAKLTGQSRAALQETRTNPPPVMALVVNIVEKVRKANAKKKASNTTLRRSPKVAKVRRKTEVRLNRKAVPLSENSKKFPEWAQGNYHAKDREPPYICYKFQPHACDDKECQRLHICVGGKEALPYDDCCGCLDAVV